jgi:hypothetical protein
MNSHDDPLDRLFRAAAKAQPRQDSAPAYGLETRAMAAWRDSLAADHGFWDMTVLVRGLIVAGVIMAMSFWPMLNSSASNPDSEYLQLADSTVSSDISP